MRVFPSLLSFIVCAAAHWLLATYFAPMGLAPNLMLALSVAAAARGGAVAGQVFGFFGGLFLDSLGFHVFGANALIFTLIGYALGSLKKQMDVGNPLAQAALVFALSPIHALLYGALGLVFEHQFLWVGWTQFFLLPFLNALAAPFASAMAKRSAGG